MGPWTCSESEYARDFGANWPHSTNPSCTSCTLGLTLKLLTTVAHGIRMLRLHSVVFLRPLHACAGARHAGWLARTAQAILAMWSCQCQCTIRSSSGIKPTMAAHSVINQLRMWTDSQNLSGAPSVDTLVLQVVTSRSKAKRDQRPQGMNAWVGGRTSDGVCSLSVSHQHHV